MKRIFEIESASGVRVDRDIVLAQMNSAAFDGCFSVKDITDGLEARDVFMKKAHEVLYQGMHGLEEALILETRKLADEALSRVKEPE